MKTTGKIAALVVAAGYSSRMGAFKPLLPLGERSMIETAVHGFQAAGIKDIRVVLGHRWQEVTPILQRLGVTSLINTGYAGGMFSSIVTGVNSLESEIDGFFLLPGDNPLFKPQTISEMLRVFWEHPAEIIYPCFDGVRGHPPLISACYIPEILTWDRPGGLRALLDCHDTASFDLAVVDQGVLLDMDTPADYQNLLDYFLNQDSPTEAECLAILNWLGTSERVTGHGKKVAQLACRWAEGLNKAGCCLEIPLLRAAGILHDLAKSRREHAAAGARILRNLGYPKVAEIIAVHTDIVPGTAQVVNEQEVLYLADKMVKGVDIVSLPERFEGVLKKYGSRPDIIKEVKHRLNNAELIKKKIECILGTPL